VYPEQEQEGVNMETSATGGRDRGADTSAAEPDLRVLAVCTGNICRSPMVEKLLRVGLRVRFGQRHTEVAVASAGIAALVGEPIDEEVASRLRRLGADPRNFVARQIDEGTVAGADVVITLTRQHRREVVALHPRAVRRTLTLLELARLVPVVSITHPPDSGPAARLRTLAQVALAHRGLLPPVHPEDDDVSDPLGRDARAYDLATSKINTAVTVVLDALAAPGDVQQEDVEQEDVGRRDKAGSPQLHEPTPPPPWARRAAGRVR
jgi:protein-tyrosine phosphatase